MAERLVPVDGVEAQGLEHRHLKDEIDPRMSDEHGEEEDSNACVEGQDVAKRHQRQAFPTKLLTHRVVDGQLLYQRTQQLELRRLSFLRAHVAYIKEKVELLEPLPPVPSEALHPSLQFDACVEFTSFFAERCPKVDVAIVVGNAALARVAKEASPKDDENNPKAPDGIEPYGYADVDADEPQFASKAIKHTADKCLLTRHASQLPVGAVVPICPDEHEHTDEVVAEVVVGKEDGRSTADDDAQQRHRDGMNMQATEEQRPQLARRASDIEFEVALCVTRLHGGKDAFP